MVQTGDDVFIPIDTSSAASKMEGLEDLMSALGRANFASVAFRCGSLYTTHAANMRGYASSSGHIARFQAIQGGWAPGGDRLSS